jgi:hypothetical protein
LPPQAPSKRVMPIKNHLQVLIGYFLVLIGNVSKGGAATFLLEMGFIVDWVL